MSKKILIIAIIIVVLAIVGVVLMVFLWGDYGGGNGLDRDNGYKFPTGATFEDKLKICLEEDLQIQTCYLIYDDSGSTLPLCENMGTLRDKCVYNVAVENSYLETCWRINSAELQEQCEEELKNGMIEEEEGGLE